MVDLLAAAAKLGAKLPVAVAREIAESKDTVACLRALSPAERREPLMELHRRWQGAPPSSFGVALLTAALAEEERRKTQAIELVWTGPESRLIPVRQTEQVLLEVIRGARARLLVVSYAVYRIGAIRAALCDALDRGVRVRIVLDVEDPENVDGYNPMVAIGRELLSRAEVLFWPREQRLSDAEERRGCLHVKCVAADAERLFISSANLTEQALRLNMELGVLITGGGLAGRIQEHFAEFVARGVLRTV
ncbi:MAG: DISARM system phospholipase D-like protein DrmC [Bryobacteraceae bacterium]|nr:DISARM system phospholipase D-like protein DrmC [Bryobacteraceae bacterium]